MAILMWRAIRNAMRPRSSTTRFITIWSVGHGILALLWLGIGSWDAFTPPLLVELGFGLYIVVSASLMLGFALAMVVVELQKLKPFADLLGENPPIVSVEHRQIIISSSYFELNSDLSLDVPMVRTSVGGTLLLAFPETRADLTFRRVKYDTSPTLNVHTP